MNQTISNVSVDPAMQGKPIEDIEIEYVPLDYLLKTINPRNPKDHDVGEIVLSILRHGFVGYVTLDPSVPMMVAGHGRLKALAAMRADGYDPPDRIEVPEVGSQGWLVPTYKKVFANQHERDAYTIGDNQTTIKGGWNPDELTTMLSSLAAADGEHGLDGTGFDNDDLDALLADKNYEPPPAPPPPELETQYGVWCRVRDKAAENQLADLMARYGYEGFRRFSEE